jgi:hypothetical protein
MAKNYRGQQSFLRLSLKKKERCYLGPYGCILHAGSLAIMGPSTCLKQSEKIFVKIRA